jgi:sec-independent protein translocase protein TatA
VPDDRTAYAAEVTLAVLEGPDLLIVLAIVLLLFGAAKVPQLARSLGEAKHEFEKGANEGLRSEDKPPTD